MKKKKNLDEFNPDLIGLTCMFSMTHKSLKNVSEIIKKVKKYSNCCGGHISNSIWNENTRTKLIEDLKDIDLFFIFEAELAFGEFINLANIKFNNIENLKQLAIRNKKKIFFANRERPEGDELNVIPDHDAMNSDQLSNFEKWEILIF